MSKTIEAFANLQSMSQEDHDLAHGCRRPVVLYDFEVCFGADALARALSNINYHGFVLVAVTQTGDKYTVFFRRLAE